MPFTVGATSEYTNRNGIPLRKMEHFLGYAGNSLCSLPGSSEWTLHLRV